MGEPKTLTVMLYSSVESVKMPLADAASWMTELLAKLPKEFRDNAWLDVSVDYGIYDDPTQLDFQIYYNRLETAEEVAAREADDAARKEAHRQSQIVRLRNNLERLEREQLR